MERRLFLWFIWLGFIVYLIFLAPPLQPDTLHPLQLLLAGKLPLVNPVHISLFSLVGIWLLIYSGLVFSDGRMQRLPAWAFMVGSIATGTVALIPYLALREPNQQFSGSRDGWLELLDSRVTGIILSASTVVLLAFAIAKGDWSAFGHEFLTNRFIHGMSLAFCLFCLLFPYPTLLKDDMARRGLRDDSQVFWLVALIPLFGPLAYFCLRPSLLTLRTARRDA